MLSKYIPYTKIYLLAFLLLAIGLSTGKFLMSLASITLASAWVLEGNFSDKWNRIKGLHYTPVIAAVGFIIHVIWLFNTTNFDYAFHDIVRKLPLLSFPIVLGSIPPLSKKNYLLIIGVFIAGLFVSTLISYGAYLELFPIKNNIADVRNISFFISHIRLSLLICLAIILLYYYFFKERKTGKIISIVLSIWFCYFLYILSGTGLIVLCLLLGYSLIWIIKKQTSPTIKIISGLIGIFLIVFSTLYIIASYKDYSDIKDKANFQDLDKTTRDGELYIHDTSSLVTENGYYLWLYVAPWEVQNAWERRSDISFDSLDRQQQPIPGTIYRYITSKGLRKDKEGVLALSDSEIAEIENGVTSCVKLSSVNKRLHQIFFEFENRKSGFSSNGHSITQRLNYSYTGMLIAKENFWLGVGTGDVPDAFNSKYEELNSDLTQENRKRAHNQLLTFLISFGAVGFALWLFSFVYPIIKLSKDKFVYGTFLVVVLISFFGDDTLETQAGVTFFAFFNSYFLFHSLHKESK